MRTPLILAALLLAAAPGLHAQAPAPPELARHLLVASGLAEQLKAYPRQVDEEIAQSRGKLPDGLLAALRLAARESYSPEAIEAGIVHALVESLPAADMREAIAWLETDVGRRVTRAEEQATARVSAEALREHAEQAQRHPPPARRTELLAALLEATRAVEHTAHMMESVALGVAVGMDAAQPAENRLGFAALSERLRLAMPPDKVRAAAAAALPVAYAYIYRTVGDADLESYLDFNRSALGTRYNEALIRAYVDALTRASIGMGPLIEQAMKRKAA